MADLRWTLLQESRPALVEAFAAEGVVRVEHVAAFPGQSTVTVWLGTGTDAQADALRAVTGLEPRVRDVLSRCGMAAADLAHVGVVVQSQETVDRDYAGSWFYALR